MISFKASVSGEYLIIDPVENIPAGKYYLGIGRDTVSDKAGNYYLRGTTTIKYIKTVETGGQQVSSASEQP